MRIINLFHIPSGKPRKLSLTAWEAMQGTPRAKNYQVEKPVSKAENPIEVVRMEQSLEAKDILEGSKPIKKNSRRSKEDPNN